MTRAGPIRNLALLALMLLAILVAAVGLGSSFMTPGRVLAALGDGGERMDAVIVWTLRLPRVLLAVQAGMALALAGAVLQRVVRNPLAAPSVLGITDGAALGVVTFLWLFSDSANALTVSIHWLPLAAALGALVFAALVACLTLLDPRGADPVRMILYGVALAALAKAAVILMVILGPVYRAGQALTWLTGTVGAAHWSDVRVLAIGLTLSIPVLICSRLSLRQLALDPMTAAASGLPLGRTQYGLLGLAVLLTALAVSQVGAVGFVGLIAPHAARLLHGQFTPGYLISTALIGGILVLAADTVARSVAPPLELPAGALTALAGAPLFLFLLMKAQGRHA